MKSAIIVSDSNENPDFCTPCGGQCCKTLPGEYWPEDFNNDVDTIKKALESGEVAIDYWDWYENSEGVRVNGYYLRPKTVNRVEVLVDASWGGQCIHLTDDGCTKEFEQRPRGCRELVPEADNSKCNSPIMKFDAVVAWEKYHSMLEDVIAEIG